MRPCGLPAPPIYPPSIAGRGFPDLKAPSLSSAVENTTHCEFAYLRDLLIR